MTSGTELSWSSCPLPQPLAHFLLQPQWQGAASGPGSMEAASPIDHSLCVDKHEQSRRGVLGMRTCVASSGPLQPRSFQLHTVVKKTRTATRFPQPLVSWVNIQVPEQTEGHGGDNVVPSDAGRERGKMTTENTKTQKSISLL